MKREAIRIDWMTEAEITEAIPPVYTEYLGTQLLRYLERAALPVQLILE